MGKQVKQNKIDLNCDYNSQSLDCLLSNYQKVKELALSLKYFLKAPSEIKKLQEYLANNKELQNIYVSIGKSVFQINDYLFSLFSSFQSIQNLKKLFLKIDQPSLQVNTIGQLLSVGLKNLNSLQELTLAFTFQQRNDSFDSHGYSLKEAYQNLKSLQSLEIIMNQAIQSSISCFSDGITCLQNLKSFAIKFKQCQLTSQNGMDYFINQLRKLTQLESLEINIDRFNKMPKHVIVELFKCLSTLSNLKTLKLYLQYIEIMKLNNLGIEKAIQSLINLEHLTFKIKFGQNLDEIISQVTCFQNLKNLKVLKFFVSVYCNEKSSTQEQHFQEFVNKLSTIQSIDSLKINFRSNFSVSHKILEILFNGLRNQQNIRSLKFNIDHLIPFEKVDNQMVLLFQDVIKKLQKFNLSIKFAEEQQEDEFTLKFWSEVLQTSNQMQQFFFNTNSKSKINIKSFGNMMKDLSNLKSCSLIFQDSQTWNEFDALLAAQSIQKMQKLENLTLFMPTQHLENIASQALIQSLVKLTELKSIDLKLKNLNQQGYQNLRQIFQNKLYLKRFNICIEDSLSQQDLLCIFESISNQNGLNFLKLYLKAQQGNQNNEIIFGSMAECISKKSQLKFLDINFQTHNCNASHMSEFFSRISCLKNLQELCLQFYDAYFTEQDMIFVRQKLQNLQKLIYLKFEINSYVSTYIINSLKDLPFLNSIQFVHDLKNFHFSRAISVKKQIEGNNAYMYNQQNQFTISNVDPFKNTIVQVKCYLEKSQLLSIDQLKYLDYCFSTLDILSDVVIRLVSSNSMGQQGAECLFTSIRQLRCLSSLLIFIEKGNSIGTQSVQVLGQSIKELKNLNSLKLYFNSQGNDIQWQEGCKIVESFQHLKEIKQLEYEIFDCQNYTVEGIKLLFDSISNLKKIEQLTIKIGLSIRLEDLNQQISESLVKMQSLKFLGIGFESVLDQTPNQLKLLCRTLRKLQNLILITLIENYTNKIQIPSNIFKQLKLVSIKKHFFGLEYIKLY
ncbi:hypothetical protein ABPG74_009836 [Tetrahymena malaccensis]